MPACCDNCRFVRSRAIFPHPDNAIIIVRQGICHRLPPRAVTEPMTTYFAPVDLLAWCGEHRWSIAGLFRAMVAPFWRT